MRFLSSVSFFLTVFVLVTVGAVAQTKPESAAASPLALSITYLKDTPPAFHPVTAPSGNPGSGWFASFGSIKGFQAEPGTLPVRAVNIVSKPDGDAVRIDVSVLLGVSYHEKEVHVGTYLLRETERVSVDDLRAFGVEPFEIAVVRAQIFLPELPTVVSCCSSLQLVRLDQQPGALPFYKLSLRNLSSKNIIALHLDLMSGGRQRLTGSPRGKHGLPLASSASTCEISLPGAKDTTATAAGYNVSIPANQSIFIRSVVYDDGSYEGDATSARSIIGIIAGEKAQLSRIVRILNQQMAESGAQPSDVVALLIRRISALEADAPQSPQVITSAGSGEQSALIEAPLPAGSLSAAMHNIKKQALDEIERYQIEHKKLPSKEEFWAWLTGLAHEYDAWLSRLK